MQAFLRFFFSNKLLNDLFIPRDSIKPGIYQVLMDCRMDAKSGREEVINERLMFSELFLLPGLLF